MLRTTQSAQETSRWERFKNRPALIGGLTVGGVVAIFVCCAGPAAIGAAVGGGGASAAAATDIGAGAIAGIIVASTVGGCLLGAAINKCFKHCRSRNASNSQGTQQITMLPTKPQDCCTPSSPVNSALLAAQNNYPSHVQAEQDSTQPECTTFQPLYGQGQSHQEDLVSLAVTAHEEELPRTVQPETFVADRKAAPIGVSAVSPR